MKKTLAILLTFMLVMSMVICVPLTASAFNPDNYKAQIKSISVGAAITGLDGKKYLPVDVHFTANEDLGDSNAVFFLEGYLKGALAGGGEFEGISGLGMTLMGPLKPDALEGAGSNAYSWQWSEGYGEGVLKYNIPLKDDADTQSVEQSQATGQQEVNCLTEGDKVSFSIETVMNTENIPPEALSGSLFSNEAELTIENISKYPKKYEIHVYDTTEPDTEETTVEATSEPSTDTEPTTFTEATEPVTAEPSETLAETTEPTTNAETTIPTETTEPVTAEPTETVTEASEPVTTASTEPESTESPQPTTENNIIVNPTDASSIPATYEVINPTTPHGNSPTQPASTEVTQPAEAETTQPATQHATQPATDPVELTVKAEKSNLKIGETTTIKIEGGSGDLKFTSGNKKVVTVDKTGKVKAVGEGKTSVTVEKGGEKKTIEFSVTKKANPFTVKNKTFKVKGDKKTVINLNKKLKFKNKKGKLTYKKKSGNKLITVSKKGKLTVKKGLKKGKTYTVKISVTDKGNNTYNKKTKTIKIKVKVKRK